MLTQSGSCPSGYFTIELDKLIPLKAGDNFRIRVKVSTNKNIGVPVTRGNYGTTSSRRITYGPETSYISFNGENWTDLYSYTTSYTQVACIKGYTTIGVNTTLTMSDLNVDFRNKANLQAYVYDQYGKPVIAGQVNFTTDGKSYLVDVIDGKAELNLTYDDYGKYDVIAKYLTTENYNGSLIASAVSINKGDTNITITYGNNVYGEDLILNVQIDRLGEQKITSPVDLIINNKTYIVNIVDGIGSIAITDKLIPNNYTVTVIFNESDKFNRKVETTNVEYLKCDIIGEVIANPIHIGEDLIFTIYSSIDKEVILEINNETYTVETVNGSGQIIISNILSGNYSYVVKYPETTINNNLTISGSVLVEKNQTFLTIRTNDLVYPNTGNIEITLLDSKNNNINGDLEITFNNETITMKITNGKANYTIPNNLNSGKYSISVKYIENDYYLASSNIANFTVTKNTPKLNTTFEKNSTELRINFTVIGEFEEAVTGFVNITFDNNSYIVNVNDKTYVISTKANGLATVKYLGDDNHLEATKTFEVVTQKHNLTITTNISYTPTTVEVILSKNITTEVILTINNINKTITVVNGKGSATLDLKTGTYTGTITINDPDYVGSATINLDVPKIKTNITTEITYNPTTIEISLSKNITTEAILTINNKNQTVNIKNGKGTVNLDLKTGNYTGTITINDSDHIGSATINLNVPKIKTNITTNIKYNPTTIEIQLSENITTEAILTINNNKKTVNIENGKGTTTLDLKTGNYTGIIEINDVEYTGSKTINLNVPKIRTELSGSDMEMYYKNGKYSVKLTDYTGKALSKVVVGIEINGIVYNRTTNENGTASINLNMEVGTYILKAIFKGNDIYSATNTSNTVVIKSTIKSDNLVKYHKNESQFLVSITDNEGNLIKNGTVTFNINGEFYNRKINDGTAKLNINLNSNTYIITILNPITNELKSNNITVLPTIIENYDLVKYFRNDSQYTVKVLDKQGNIMQNTSIQLNINGVLYKRTTNADGIAKMNINLNPGTYTITVIHGEFLTSNTITVKSTIVSNNLEMNQGDGSRFKVTILDKQGKIAGAGEKFVLNINGVLYYRTTNENGTAALNINLMAGTYIITCQYGDCLQSNTITIR